MNEHHEFETDKKGYGANSFEESMEEISRLQNKRSAQEIASKLPKKVIKILLVTTAIVGGGMLGKEAYLNLQKKAAVSFSEDFYKVSIDRADFWQDVGNGKFLTSSFDKNTCVKVRDRMEGSQHVAVTANPAGNAVNGQMFKSNLIAAPECGFRAAAAVKKQTNTGSWAQRPEAYGNAKNAAAPWPHYTNKSFEAKSWSTVYAHSDSDKVVASIKPGDCVLIKSFDKATGRWDVRIPIPANPKSAIAGYTIGLEPNFKRTCIF